jgi:hypothetical protein
MCSLQKNDQDFLISNFRNYWYIDIQMFPFCDCECVETLDILRGSVVVKELGYKPEGHGFEIR